MANTNTNEVKPVNPLKDENAKDGLALVVGGLFILALVFAAYNYFSKGAKTTDLAKNGESINLVEESKNDASKEKGTDSTQGDVNGNGATDDKSGDTTTNPQTDTPKNDVAYGTGGTTDPSLQVADSSAAYAVWTANDYKQGDIKSGNYTVKSGDTLWEIAEAVYGNGAEWGKVLEANKANVGFLSNGSQALIMPGQVLVLP